MSNRLKAFAVGAAMLAASFSAKANAADNVVIRWNNAVLEAIRNTHPGPTIVARDLFVLQTCEYDAWASYDAKAIGLHWRAPFNRRPVHERTPARKQQAVSFAAYRAAVDLFPSEKPIFDGLMAQLGYNPADKSTDIATPAGIGNTACARVLAFRHRDGANQLGDEPGGTPGVPYSDWTGYIPVNPASLPTGSAPPNPDHWEPLIVNGVAQKYVTPHWGKVKPFALKSLSQYKVKAPAKAGTRAYREQAREVLSYSATLTDAQKVIAEYWADGPSSELPPGHWNLFAQFVSRRDRHSLDADVKMFFALNNALLDASVWVWGLKRQFDYIRPVSAIHYLFIGKPITAFKLGSGTTTFSGEQWLPYQAAGIVTPPFPEYVSGHSAFSAAAAAALRNVKGSDVFGFAVTFPAGSSFVEPGLVPATALTLSWATFTDAADEAGISRRYGGIHFKDGDLESRRIGTLIGDAAFAETKRLFNGLERTGF